MSAAYEIRQFKRVVVNGRDVAGSIDTEHKVLNMREDLTPRQAFILGQKFARIVHAGDLSACLMPAAAVADAVE
jgi:hypothetical protein